MACSMKTIPLSLGKVAIVDDDDYDAISEHKWHAVKRRSLWHAMRTEKRNGHKKTIYMHRIIVGALPGEEVDHKSGDGLDNRKENLRRCTHRQNGQHRKLPSQRKTSRFHGVHWYGQRNRWRVVICAGPRDASGKAKQLHVGLFRNEIDAARAYDAAAIEHFGTFAITNFPREEYAA